MSRRWRWLSKASCPRRSQKHVESWPRDAVVLPLGAFGLFAFSGMADHDQARQDLCERHASHFGEDSHAQREIVEDTFIVALIRSGDSKRARALLDARLHRRPSARDRRWQMAAA